MRGDGCSVAKNKLVWSRDEIRSKDVTYRCGESSEVYCGVEKRR